MLTRTELENLIYNTVDIVPPQGQDSVFLGVFCLVDNEQILDQLLHKITRYYDQLLATLPLTPHQRLLLQFQRCFRYEEYQLLFSSSIKEQHYLRHPIYKTLLITTNAERLLFIRNNNRDESYKSFVACLQNWVKVHNPSVFTLIYEVHD